MAAAACNVHAADFVKSDLMITLFDTMDLHIRCVIYLRMQVVTLSSPAEAQCHPVGPACRLLPQVEA